MAYNVEIPAFLHNRPRPLINHQIHRLEAAKEQFKENDILHVKQGVFKVPSDSRDGLLHTVSFGGNGRMPHCTCEDWAVFHWPCKHFLVVFLKVEGWGWEQLSSEYRDSPYFKLDSVLMEKYAANVPLHPHVTAQMEYVIESPEENQSQVNTPEVEKPEDCTPIHRSALRCREVIKKLNQLTYECQDTKKIDSLHDSLENLYEGFVKDLPHEDGLMLHSGKYLVIYSALFSQVIIFY